MERYSLTTEHRAQLEPWARRWIANALSTAPMTDQDREICRDAVRRLYRVAKLEPPPDHRIVFVPSPFVLRFAGGFSAAIWYSRKTRAATRAATDAATDAATRAATYAATDDEEDLSRWYVVPGNLRRLADELGVGDFGLRCTIEAYRMWQGGNQWSAWDSFLTFFRHVAQLPLDYTAWDAWETLSLHSGPRIVHPEFCMISDRPEVLTIDSDNRPHNEGGPFCRWRDGSCLYSVHGVRVPAWIVEQPNQITVQKIDDENNAEIRRVMMNRYGTARFLEDSGAELVHCDDWGTLYRREMPDDEPFMVVKVVNSTAERDGTFKDYFLRVHPELRPLLGPTELGEPQALTARNAVASTFGLRGEEYAPCVQT